MLEIKTHEAFVKVKELYEQYTPDTPQFYMDIPVAELFLDTSKKDLAHSKKVIFKLHNFNASGFKCTCYKAKNDDNNNYYLKFESYILSIINKVFEEKLKKLTRTSFSQISVILTLQSII